MATLRSNTLSIDQARLIALAAQGFGRKRPTGATTNRHFDAMLDDIGLIQIDSVNVLVRSQELPLFARLGHHGRDLIPAATQRHQLFEYWGHEAAHIPIAHYPLWRWKMERSFHYGTWKSLIDLNTQRPDFVASVLDYVRVNGPTVSGDLKTRTEREGAWWDWDQGKTALEWLFWTGQLTATRRATDFARLYDLPERVIPTEILNLPTPTETEAKLELLRLASRHHGVGTAADLCDYYRLKLVTARPLLQDLVDEGTVFPVTVEGWKDQAYLNSAAKIPRSIDACALLSPFDPVVWFRPRAERLFDFHYRIEIYTPAHKRVFGYYVLPVLIGDRLVGRVDLKADRQAGVLRCHGVFTEPGVHPNDIIEQLDGELELMAEWLGLSEGVEYGTNGNVVVG